MGDTRWENQDPESIKIWLPSSTDASTGPMLMKRTDQCTYLGFELHKMLEAYKGITSLFEQKRDYLSKVFADPDDDDDDDDDGGGGGGGGGAEYSHASSHSGENPRHRPNRENHGRERGRARDRYDGAAQNLRRKQKGDFEEEIEKEHLETYDFGPGLKRD